MCLNIELLLAVLYVEYLEPSLVINDRNVTHGNRTCFECAIFDAKLLIEIGILLQVTFLKLKYLEDSFSSRRLAK